MLASCIQAPIAARGDPQFPLNLADTSAVFDFRLKIVIDIVPWCTLRATLHGQDPAPAMVLEPKF